MTDSINLKTIKGTNVDINDSPNDLDNAET